MALCLSTNLSRWKHLMRSRGPRNMQSRDLQSVRAAIDKVAEGINMRFGYSKSVATDGDSGVSSSLCVWPSVATVMTNDTANMALLSYHWSPLEVSLPMALMLISGGCTATIFGPLQHAAGPRKALAYSAMAFGSGLAVGSLGLHLQWLPLMYMGYGTLWGIGAGMAYSPCLHALMEWNPERRGLMAGLSTACVSGGMLGASLLVKPMLNFFAKPSQYIGSGDDVLTREVGDQLFASVGGQSDVEVVKVLSNITTDLAEGLYVAGSGSNGAIETLASIGLGCVAVTMVSAHTIRIPQSTEVDKQNELTANSTAVPAEVETEKKPLDVDDTSPDADNQHHVLLHALKSPQLHLFGTGIACMSLAAMGLFSSESLLWQVQTVASAMDTEASTHLLPLALGSSAIVGALCFGGISDVVGRGRVGAALALSAVPVFAAMPYAASLSATLGVSPATSIACGSTVIASITAGMHSVLPAHLTDIYSHRYTSPQYGFMVLYSTAAILYGEDLFNRLQEVYRSRFLDDLLAKMPAEDVAAALQVPVDGLRLSLLQQPQLDYKLWSLTSVDPYTALATINTPGLYTMAGLAAVATISNSMAHARSSEVDVNNLTSEAPQQGKRYRDKRKISRDKKRRDYS